MDKKPKGGGKKVKLEFKPKIIDEDTVKFVIKVTLHLPEELRWRFNKETVEFVKKIYPHPYKRLKCKSKKVKQEPKLELIKSEPEVEFAQTAISHPRHRLQKKAKKKKKNSRWKFDFFTKQFSI